MMAEETMTLAQIPERYAQPDPATLSYLPKGGTELAYQGHAEITLALIAIDPEWSWEPAGIDPETGGPLITPRDKRLVMWGYLTLLGVRRMGVGTCEANKSEPEKELLGDLLRNAAMRFGVATKLWSKAEGETGDAPAGKRRSPARPAANRGPQAAKPPQAEGIEGAATQPQINLIAIECKKHGIDDDHRVEFVAKLVGRPIKSTKDLTREEASQAIEQLKATA